MKRSTRDLAIVLKHIMDQVPDLFFAFVRFTDRWMILIVLFGGFGTVFTPSITQTSGTNLPFAALLIYSLFMPAISSAARSREKKEDT